MKIAIYTYSDNFTLDLAIELIPKGIEPIETKTTDEAIAVLEHDENILVFVSESTDEEFIKKIKETRKDIYLFLIIHKSFKPKDIIKLNQYGINAIIEYNENVSVLGESIVENIIHNNIKTNERRMHVRINPNPYEQSTAAVYIRDLNKFIKGKIVDISAGGVAIKVADSLDASLLNTSAVYDPVFIQIRGMEIRTVSKVMGKRKDMAGFRFENIEPDDMRKLSSYIHMRISEKSDEFKDKLTSKNQ